MSDSPRWWVIVPLKDTRRAKSRIGGDQDDRRGLAVSMARDTLRAAAAASCVDGVVLVCDQRRDRPVFTAPHVRVVARPGLELNQALEAGAVTVRSEALTANLAVLPADLPYLKSEELASALGRAARYPRCVVADRAGTGTTLLTARAGVDLGPSYGPDSLRLHLALGATELLMPSGSGLRRDVDYADDLVPITALGWNTRQLLEDRAECLAPGGPAA
jgi:2-phospho-L-lactate/phosphoenolpyruvate guanylyltransferase